MRSNRLPSFSRRANRSEVRTPTQPLFTRLWKETPGTVAAPVISQILAATRGNPS